MPEEVVTPAEPTLPSEPTSVRDAIKQARDAGIPIYTPDAPAAPVEPVAPAADPIDAAVDELNQPAAAAVVDDPSTAAAATTDPFSEFGGRAEVEMATQIAQGMRTESGMRLIIAQGLTALGYSPDAVRNALENRGATPVEAAAAAAQSAAPAATDPYADLSDDDVVTGADLKRIVQQAVQAGVSQTAQSYEEKLAAATKPLAESFQTERQSRATATVDSTLVEVLGPPPADPKEQAAYQTMAQAILQQAAPFVQADNWDPGHIRTAVLRGHAAFTAAQDAALRAYATRKAADRAAQPAHVSGSPAGGEAPAEPKNVKEAIAARKAAGVR